MLTAWCMFNYNVVSAGMESYTSIMDITGNLDLES